MEDEFVAGVVCIDGTGEGAIDDDDDVDVVVALVGENFKAGGGGGCRGGVVWDPVALVDGLGVDVEGLGGEAGDGEVVEAAAVGAHEDEVVGGGAVGVEHALDDAGGEHALAGGLLLFLLGGRGGELDGWLREGGVGDLGGA